MSEEKYGAHDEKLLRSPIKGFETVAEVTIFLIPRHHS